MKKKTLTIAVSALLAATSFGVFGGAPASAADVCVGVGAAHLNDVPFFYVGPPQSSSFSFGLGVAGACSSGGSLNATGNVTGSCGRSSGTGVTGGGAAFSFIGSSSMLVITGGVIGLVNAQPNALSGDSCLTGADDFLIQGAAVIV